MSTEWRRVIGGLILASGFLTALTLALFVTHPCDPIFEGEVAFYDDCGAVVPALAVSGASLILGMPLVLSGRKPSVKWLTVALLGLIVIVLVAGVGALRVLSTTFLCLPNDDCGTRGFLPGGNWILIVGGSLLVTGGVGYLFARRRAPDDQSDSQPLPEGKAVT